MEHNKQTSHTDIEDPTEPNGLLCPGPYGLIHFKESKTQIMSPNYELVIHINWLFLEDQKHIKCSLVPNQMILMSQFFLENQKHTALPEFGFIKLSYGRKFLWDDSFQRIKNQ